MLTLGFASSLFYYNEINKKNEIVMTEELYNPSVYKEEVVELAQIRWQQHLSALL